MTPVPGKVKKAVEKLVREALSRHGVKVLDIAPASFGTASINPPRLPDVSSRTASPPRNTPAISATPSSRVATGVASHRAAARRAMMSASVACSCVLAPCEAGS